MLSPYPRNRPRRLRQSIPLRELLRETSLTKSNLIQPLFIHHGKNVFNPISSMPGQFQLSIDKLDEEIGKIKALGLKGIMLFGIPEIKDALGSNAFDDNGVIQQAIRYIKNLAPNLLIFADCCFCEYTDHGHCGMIKENFCGEMELDNDKTLEALAKIALAQAKAGADIIAPSGMMDGMVSAIRAKLDENGFSHIPILSYSVKYASSLYGPFREAALGAPQFGDRKSYQMDFYNRYEALKEAALDIAEGADMLMVKPASLYLDILFQLKNQYPQLPLAAYQVSGEYAMIKAAAEMKWLNHDSIMLESLVAIKRAGADFIISYFAKEFAEWENKQ